MALHKRNNDPGHIFCYRLPMCKDLTVPTGSEEHALSFPLFSSSQLLTHNPSQRFPLLPHQSDGRPRHSSNTLIIPSENTKCVKRVLFPHLFSQLHSFASSSRKPKGLMPFVSPALMLSSANVETEKTYKRVNL